MADLFGEGDERSYRRGSGEGDERSYRRGSGEGDERSYRRGGSSSEEEESYPVRHKPVMSKYFIPPNKSLRKPKHARTYVLVASRHRVRSRRPVLDLGALWRLQRVNPLDSNKKKTGTIQGCAFLQRNIRKRPVVSPPHRLDRPVEGQSTMMKNVGVTGGIEAETRAESDPPANELSAPAKDVSAEGGEEVNDGVILAPIDDNDALEDEYSTEMGDGSNSFPFGSSLGDLAAASGGPSSGMDPPPPVMRPPSPGLGPFHLKSVFERKIGSGSFPLIVDEERSLKGLQSSGDSDLITPPSALFKF